MNIVRLLRKSISTKTRVLLDKCLETNQSHSRFYCEGAVDHKKLSVQSLVEEISKLTRGLYFHSENNEEVVKVLRRHSLEDKAIIRHLSRSPKLFLASAVHFSKVINQVKALGLTLGQAMELLEKNPEIVKQENFDNVHEVIGELKSFGLNQREVQAMLSKNPLMVSTQVANVKLVCKKLTNYFSKAEAKAILVKSPNLLTEDVEETTARIFYGHDEMGISKSLFAKSELLSQPFKEVVARHKFLERMGLYKTADPRVSVVTVIEGGNPEYRDIFKPKDKHFARNVAQSTLEEYQTFKELLEYERKQYDRNADDYLDDDDDDDDNLYGSDEDGDDNEMPSPSK